MMRKSTIKATHQSDPVLNISLDTAPVLWFLYLTHQELGCDEGHPEESMCARA